MLNNIKTFSNKDFFTSFLLVFGLFLSIYLSALFGILAISYLYYIPLLLIFLILKGEIIIVLYIIILPTAGIIPSDYNLFGIFGLDEFISIFTLYYLFTHRFINGTKFYIQRISTKVIVIIMFIFLLTNYTNAYYQIYEGSYFIVVKRLLFFILKYSPLVFVILHLRNYKLRKNVLIGIFISIFVIVLSQISTPHLAQIGLYTFDDSEFAGLARNIESIGRFSGIYNGDPNSAGAYLAMIIGFLFIKIEKKEMVKYANVIIIVAIMGILLTASRTVISSLFLITIIFIINNRTRKSAFYLITFLLLLFFGLNSFIMNQLSRFHDAGLQVDTNVEGNRIMKWVHYMTFMSENPVYFITGSQEEINNRSAHNVFVQMVFNIGILPTTVFFLSLAKSGMTMLKNNSHSIYYIIPFIFITMFVGELTEVSLFLLLGSLHRIENRLEGVI